MPLLAALSFLTRFRLGPHSMEEVGRSMALFPLVGALIGLLLASASLLLDQVPRNLGFFHPLLLLVLLYATTGVHHFDGLTDLADGLAATGPRESKLKALRDPALGAGGLLAGGLALLALFSAFRDVAGTGLQASIALLVPAEMGAKHAMVLGALLGKPLGEGSGREFMAHASAPRVLASFLLTAAATVGLWLWAFGASGLLPAAVLLTAGHLVTKAVVTSAHRGLRGVNGDVLGACNEVTRVVLLGLSVIL